MENGIHKLILILIGLIFFKISCNPGQRINTTGILQEAEHRYELGDFAEALQGIDQGLRSGGNEEEVWQFRLLKAKVFIWQGLSNETVELLAMRDERVETMPSHLAAQRKALLGIAYSNLQRLDEANEEFVQAQSLNHPFSSETNCEILLGQGKIAAIEGKFYISEQQFRDALKTARQNHFNLLQANALGNLGMLQMKQHHYADAVDFFNESLMLAQSLHAQAPRIRTIGNLGWAYLQMGDLERAFDSFQRAEALSQQYSMASDNQTWRMNIAAVLYLQRNYDAAETAYQSSLNLARQLKDKQEMIYGLNGLARIAINKGNISLAQRYNNEAIALEIEIEDHDGRLYSNLNVAQIFKAEHRENEAIAILQDIAKSTTNAALLAETFDSWAQLEADRGHNQAAAKLFEKAIAILDQDRRSLKREDFELSFPRNAKDTYDNYVDFLVAIGEQARAFTVIESHRAKVLVDNLERTNRDYSVHTIVAAAKKNRCVILSYWLGRNHSYLWVISSNGYHLEMLPAEDKINADVRWYQAKLVSPIGSDAINTRTGQDLYRMLVGPATQLLSSAKSRFIIIPDGILCNLNFETLAVPSQQPHYWIEDALITESSSVDLLMSALHNHLEFNQFRKSKILIVGNPISPTGYVPLLHAAEEVDSVKKYFDPNEVTLLTGKGANPRNYFAAKPSQFGIIHFVAHGTASRLSPLDSAVVLSDDGSSYNLYARQVAASKLNANLVIVSACDSAGSRVYSSEGLVGLSWAFLHAGAHQVISALWEVNDSTTPKLFNRFYAELAEGKDIPDALRNAKLAMIHENSKQAKPFFWAPFIVYQGRSN